MTIETVNQKNSDNLADNTSHKISPAKLRETLFSMTALNSENPALSPDLAGRIAGVESGLQSMSRRLGNHAIFASDPSVSGKEQESAFALPLVERADTGFDLIDAVAGDPASGIVIPNTGRYFVYFSVRIKNKVAGSQSNLCVTRKAGSSTAVEWEEYKVIPYSGATGIPSKDYYSKFFTVAEFDLNKNDVIVPMIGSQVPFTIEDYFISDTPIISGLELIIQELH
ncbi:hypothetical protein [Endozoicomonas sp. Mp262]|uniref:hypothetical protein n=1 Tax=Endozoicomonas sp. Mp262 TaxID=2919499 RepID=UPI0021D863DB